MASNAVVTRSFLPKPAEIRTGQLMDRTATCYTPRRAWYFLKKLPVLNFSAKGTCSSWWLLGSPARASESVPELRFNVYGTLHLFIR
jgi:hypothetical protein